MKYLIAIPFVIAIAALLYCIPALILLIAWNIVMPVFGLPAVSFVQSYALVVVFSVLFGGIRGKSNSN